MKNDSRKQNGGARQGSGRHKKNCACAKCAAKRIAEREDDGDDIPEADTSTNDTANNSAGNQQPDTTTTGTGDSTSHGVGDNKPSDSNTPTGENKPDTPATPIPEKPKGNGVDFSRYKKPAAQTTNAPNANANTQQSAGKTGTKTKKPMQVAINGKVLLAVVNFIVPALFGYIGRMANGDYLAEDFKLEAKDMTDLIPAADVVAQEIFQNISPMMQLIIGYGCMSWAQASFKMKMRLAGKETKV